MFNKEINKECLKKAIQEVIVFFDLFNYPLTIFEIWKYLRIKCNLNDIVAIEEGLKNDPIIESKNGFYFLQGRVININIRNKRYNYTHRKFKRAMRIARIFRFIPWIKMMAVVNIIGSHNLSDDSDIDFFIITQKKRIWLTRFFCILIIKILGLRPKPDNMRDKICLSFFVSENFLNLKKLMLKEDVLGDNGFDIYFVYWLAGLTPIYERGGMYKKFIQANDWLKNYLPNWQSAKITSNRFEKGKWQNIGNNKLFDLLEKISEKYQLKIMPEKIKKKTGKNTFVVLGDDIIKTHINDRREKYYRQFYSRLNSRITHNS